MTNVNRQQLLDEATELGLDFPPNVKTYKLQVMIAEAKGEPVPIQETAPRSPAVKDDVTENTSAPKSKVILKRERIAKLRKAAFATQIVTITNKDNRENEHMTTVRVSFENQYFGLSKIIPLDIRVEIEKALLDIITSTTMTLHKDEIAGGKRTGNKIATTVPKFAISYSKEIPDAE